MAGETVPVSGTLQRETTQDEGKSPAELNTVDILATTNVK